MNTKNSRFDTRLMGNPNRRSRVVSVEAVTSSNSARLRPEGRVCDSSKSSTQERDMSSYLYVDILMTSRSVVGGEGFRVMEVVD